MATVTRKTKLVNPKWSWKQIKSGFGNYGPVGSARRKAAVASKRSNASHRTATKPRLKANASRPRPKLKTNKHRPRKNISGIAVAGLPAMNPASKRSNMTKAKKNKSRPQSSAKRSNWGHKHYSKPKHHTAAKKKNPTATKVVTRWKIRNAPKKPMYAKKRPNPMGGASGSFLVNSTLGATGAVLSRIVPNWVLGANNTGIVGYIANGVTGAGLAWVAKKFGPSWMRGEGAKWILGGAGIALVLRIAQDYLPGPVSSYVQSGGLGDPGVGALLPSAYVDPAIYTGNGAQVRVPPAWQPAPLPAPMTAAKTGMGTLSTYGVSTYSR